MGLFDKLRETVNNAKNTINGSIKAYQEAKDPLADETVKKYLEIIFGMTKSLSLFGDQPTENNEKAKNYIEYFIGESCDEEKLQRALGLYNRARFDTPQTTEDIPLVDFGRSAKKSTTYLLEKHKASRMFCQSEIETATVEYNNILEIIKDNVNYSHFSQGLKKMSSSDAIKNIVIANSFLDNNPITQELVLVFLFDTYVARMNNSTYTYLYDWHDDFALLAMKALHFEEYGANRESYETVTDEEYRNAVLSITCYKKSIDDHPFEKEEYINKYVTRIKKHEDIFGIYTNFESPCHYIESPDDYFCDAVSHLAWKTISKKRDWIDDNGESISESKNINDVFSIIGYYLRHYDDFNQED